MSALHKASVAGDVQRIVQLISQGADLECHDEQDGMTPLMAACLSPTAGVDAVALLLDHGADIHACCTRDFDKNEQLISMAVRSSSLGKIRLLLESGANPDPPSRHGYTLLTLAACADRMDVFDLLLDAGSPREGRSSYGESALSVLSNNGRFDRIGMLLDLGVDPAPLEWSDLHREIATGGLDGMAHLLDGRAEIEEKDGWERTPFLMAIQNGDLAKVELLLAKGAKITATGRCGKTAMQYPIGLDDSKMMEFLIAKGLDVELEDEHGSTALMDAVEQSAVACFHVLIAAGAEWEKNNTYRDALIQSASDPVIIRKLIELGANPSDLEAEEIRVLVGLEVIDSLPIDRDHFLEYRTRRFGRSNPERLDVPFWKAMVRNGWSGYRAGEKFGVSAYGEEKPIWSHDRFGMSLTLLPDGRFVQIAGEHEDGYDPDFCIYNDVFVYDGKSGFEIFGFPAEVFPPTDFHSATHIAPWIYIIGNLSYPEIRAEFDYVTPVFRLHIDTWEMERVVVEGESPGWIHSHSAVIVDGQIRISGGKIQTMNEDGANEIVAHTSVWDLDLERLKWNRIGDAKQ